MRSVPVLDVGGTHVTAARVDPQSWRIVSAPVRVEIDSHGSADEILDGFAAAAAGIAPEGTLWAVAMPDPFDYPAGVGRFHDVGKFESLDGVDVRAGLRPRLPGRPDEIVFCNDADAFAVGEWVAGAGTGSTRLVGLTLGTGVGSGWVDAGEVVDPGLPPGGRAHLLRVDGLPLEELMSRRAIRRAYADATGGDPADVRAIAERARGGDPVAGQVLARALRALGYALAPALRDFAPDVIVLGGSMSASWDLFEPWFREGTGAVAVPPVRVAADPEAAALRGATHVALGPPRV